MSISKKAILQVQELSRQAENLARGGASERAQAQVLITRIKSIERVGLSTDEARALYAEAVLEDAKPRRAPAGEHPEYRAAFDRYVRGRADEREMRDFLSGSQSLSYTQGIAGGFTVPMQYDGTLREAMAQVTPVLDEDVCDFSMTDGPQLNPEQISGYDLSSVAAQLIGESAQQNPQAIPTVLGKTLNSNFIFKASFAGSYEAEIDLPDFPAKITRAVSVALARTIGAHVLTGTGGSTDISGIRGQLPTSFNIGTGINPQGSQAFGNVTAEDLVNVYFGIDRFYRNSPKCGFLKNDGVYKAVRNAVDNIGRPLLRVSEDKEELFGKPVYVAPSLAQQSIAGGFLIFGDLSHIVIRASRPQIQRSMEQAQADISRGEALWVGRCRADATLFDPSNGSNPPIVMAVLL